MNIKKLEKQTLEIKDINSFIEDKYPNLESIICWNEEELEDKFIMESELSLYQDKLTELYLLVIDTNYVKRGYSNESCDQLYTFIEYKNIYELFETLPVENKRKEFLEKILKNKSVLTNSDIVSYIRWYNNKFQSL